AHPSTEALRAHPHIHGDVPDFAVQHADQLPLPVRLLEMEPAEHPAARPGNVVLHELRGQPQRVVAGLVPALQEMPALVAKDPRLDQEQPAEAELPHVHVSPSAATTSSRYRP